MGKFRRLYPVPFRLLEGNQKFKKWEWIDAKVQRANDDQSGVNPSDRGSGLRGCEKTVASEGRWRSAGAQETECMLKYMRIPSTAGTRDPERSRFFHNL
ncbi:MAG: hypothetical protein ACREUD_03765 [Gammaproteobacteria bacterium]